MSDYRGTATMPGTEAIGAPATALTPTRISRVRDATMTILWVTCGVLLFVDAVWMRFAGISIASSGLLKLPLACSALLALRFFYGRLRPEPRIAIALDVVLYLVVFSAAAAVLSYLIVGTDAPLVDDAYIRADVALGFHWLAWFEFVRAHAGLREVLHAAYASLLPQMVPLVLVLAFRRHFDDLRAFAAAMTVAIFITLLVSGFFPAASAFIHYGVGSRADLAQLSHFGALRSHRLHSIDLTQLQGLVSMPSFHTALALLYVWAMRRCPIWCAGFAVLDALLVLSTLSEGGHYLVDVLGGATTALVSIGCIGYGYSLGRAGTARVETACTL